MKRLLSLLLVLAMVLSMVPAVFAQDWEGDIDVADPIEPEIETIEIEDINNYTNVTMTADGTAVAEYQWTATEAGTLDIYPVSTILDATTMQPIDTEDVTATATLTVTKNGEAVNIADTFEVAPDDVFVITPTVTMSDGSTPEVTFDIYGRFVGPEGSVNNPIQISVWNSPFTTPSIEPGKEVYYTAYSTMNYIFTLEDPNAYVVYQGRTVYPTNGVISFSFIDGNMMQPTSFSIGTNAAADAAGTYEFSIVEPPYGSEANPEIMYGLYQQTATLNAENNYTYVYQWSSYEAGKLYLTVDDIPEGADVDVLVESLGMSKSFNYDADLDENDNLVLVVDVEANCDYKFKVMEFGAWSMETMSYAYVGGDVTFTPSFVPTRYTVTWEESDEYTIWASETADIVPGDDVTVFVSAKDGYKLGDAVVKANDETLEAVAPGVYVITVNADTVITVEGASAEAPAPIEEPKVAYVGSDSATLYSLNDAIALAAQTGTAEAPVTVTLVKDYVDTSAKIIVEPGVALDLVTYKLEVNTVIGLNGSYVMTSKRYSKSSGEDDHGRVVVAKDNMILSETTLKPSATSTNKILPIWLPAKNHYVFANLAYAINSVKASYDEANDMFTVSGQDVTGGDFTGVDFADNGSSDNGIKFIVRASWEVDTGTHNDDYVYFDEYVMKALEPGYALSYTLTGLKDVFNMDFSTFKVTLIVQSDCGAAWVIDNPYVINQ